MQEETHLKDKLYGDLAALEDSGIREGGRCGRLTKGTRKKKNEAKVCR